MKTVQWVHFVAMMGLGGLLTWTVAHLAIAAFNEGLAFIGVPLALSAVVLACIMVRGFVVGLFGSERPEN